MPPLGNFPFPKESSIVPLLLYIQNIPHKMMLLLYILALSINFYTSYRFEQ